MRMVKSKVFMMSLSASGHEVLTWNILLLSVSFCTGGQVSLIVSLEGKMGSYLACSTTCLV